MFKMGYIVYSDKLFKLEQDYYIGYSLTLYKGLFSIIKGGTINGTK